MMLRLTHKPWATVVLLGAFAIAGCAGLATRAVIPVEEIPAGDYEVRTLVALAPPKQPDGEIVAAVLYTKPSGPRVEVWEGSYPTGSRGWLLEQTVGRGTGKDHLRIVKSPAHYQTVILPGQDGRPIGYALLHRAGVRASLQDWSGKTVLFLSAVDFIDPDYIRSDDGGRQ